MSLKVRSIKNILYVCTFFFNKSLPPESPLYRVYNIILDHVFFFSVSLYVYYTCSCSDKNLLFYAGNHEVRDNPCEDASSAAADVDEIPL